MSDFLPLIPIFPFAVGAVTGAIAAWLSQDRKIKQLIHGQRQWRDIANDHKTELNVLRAKSIQDEKVKSGLAAVVERQNREYNALREQVDVLRKKVAQIPFRPLTGFACNGKCTHGNYDDACPIHGSGVNIVEVAR